MAKRTAIIDIGSNSISLVVYEKSSRYAFHLIEKVRARVRIGEGAYEKGGELQDEAMDKAFGALKDFLIVAETLKCRKILAVATSALRDAPNKKLFLKRVQKELKLSIKVIDGPQEAHFGAVAAMNLLEPLESFTTIDIGGGSTELAKVDNGKIVSTLSLDLGTVRLKELYVDKGENQGKSDVFIKEVISQIPPDIFSSSIIVGIGGTIRALSAAIMIKEQYPIKSLHGFDYRVKDYLSMLESIPTMDIKGLKKLDISSSRFDTIQEGTAIFNAVIEHLGAEVVISSKAGVREGVYLSDILRNSNQKFPHNFNVSIKSLIDRYALSEKNCAYVQRVALKIFEALSIKLSLADEYKEVVGFSAKLSPISKLFNIYSNSNNSFYFLLENLNFTFSHDKKVLIALLLELSSKEKNRHREYKKYDMLLPEWEVIEHLYFILRLSECINSNKKLQKIEISLEENTIMIGLEENSYLCQECIERLQTPLNLKIKIVV